MFLCHFSRLKGRLNSALCVGSNRSKNVEYTYTWQESLAPPLYPAHIISSYMTTLMPLLLCHRSHCRLSIMGTSTAWRVFGRSLDPGKMRNGKKKSINKLDPRTSFRFLRPLQLWEQLKLSNGSSSVSSYILISNKSMCFSYSSTSTKFNARLNKYILEERIITCL